MADEETGRVRDLYDRHARRYDPVIAVVERVLLGDGRAWAAGQASGSTLEVAIGTGRNLPYYAAGTKLTGIDISEGMLRRARGRATGRGDAVNLHVGDAELLPFVADSFDTVIATLALCSIPDHEMAVEQMARVLRPGGRLVLLEHVASTGRVIQAIQRILDPLFVRVEGDHLLRDPVSSVTRAGLVIDMVRRSRLGLVMRLAAHKPT